MTWVVVFALESTSDISFIDSIFILVIGGLAMSVPVQGGIGAFHYIVSRGIVVITWCDTRGRPHLCDINS